MDQHTEIPPLNSVSPKAGRLSNICKANNTTTFILTKEYLSKQRCPFPVVLICPLLQGDKMLSSMFNVHFSET